MTVLFLHENFNLKVDAEIFPMSILLARHFGIFLHFMIENLDDIKECVLIANLDSEFFLCSLRVYQFVYVYAF